MSKFGKFDEKETKEGNIRRIVSRCLERMRHDHVRTCEDKKIEEVSGILSELLTEKEAKDLLSIANYSKILEKGDEYEDSGLEDKFWRESDKNSDWEKFLKSFYYEVLPTVLLYNPRFNEVRGDFLRYFILWDNFSEEKKMAKSWNTDWIPKDSFEASKRNEKEKLEILNDIRKLYEYTARSIQLLHFIEPPDKKYYPTEMIYSEKKISCNLINATTFCFYRVFKGLLNNIDLLKTLIKDKVLTPEIVLDYMFRHDYLFKTFEIKTMCAEGVFHTIEEGEDLESVRREEFEKYGTIVCESDEEINALTEPKKGSIDLIFHYETRKELAEILFSWDEMTAYLADGDVFKSVEYEMKNTDFFSVMMKLDPGYRMPLIRRVAEREVKKIEDLENAIYFTALVAYNLFVRVRICCGEEAVEPDEVKKMLLGISLREKIVGTEWFKNLPELFQHLVIVEQARKIFNKAEVVVLPEVPETNIDKNALKKDVDKFMSELKKIAKSGGKPSAYYANEHFDSEDIPDSESYLTTLISGTAVTFLKDSFGPWKAVKPMLAIFRNLREQAYSIDIKYYEYKRYIWAFVPLRLTPLLGSLEDEEAAEVCEEWFKHLAGELKSADDFVVKKREENPETVPEEFRDGYDIKVIEPHPLWREAYCEAAGDLRVNLGFNNCKIFNHLKNNDIDKDVREAAEKTLERIEKITGKFDSGSRKRALLNAWWWYRVAHLKSLGIDFDWVAAQNLKIKEVKINYQKNY